MNADQELVYNFLQLPHTKRREIAEKIELISAQDFHLSEDELDKLILRRANIYQHTSALWIHVCVARGVPFEPNPFKKPGDGKGVPSTKIKVASQATKIPTTVVNTGVPKQIQDLSVVLQRSAQKLTKAFGVALGNAEKRLKESRKPNV